MARRYGGKYSPDGDQAGEEAPPPRGQYDGARVDPAGARANLLFVPPIPLVFLSLNDGAIGMTLGLVAAGLLTAAALLLREGLRAESAYHARRSARRPAFPRKIFASVLTGLGVGLAAWRNAYLDTGGAENDLEQQLAAWRATGDWVSDVAGSRGWEASRASPGTAAGPPALAATGELARERVRTR